MTGRINCKGGVFMKKAVSITVVLVMMLSLMSFSVSAKVPEVNHPNYSYTSSCSSSVTFSGNTATCISEVIGYPNITTKVQITQALEISLGNGWWYKLYSWNDTYVFYRGILTNSVSGITESGTYHVRMTAKVYSGSSYETIEIFSSPVTH